MFRNYVTQHISTYSWVPQKCDVESHCKCHMNTCRFVCDMSGKGFTNKRLLSEHLLTHSMEKKLKYAMCTNEYKLHSLEWAC